MRFRELFMAEGRIVGPGFRRKSDGTLYFSGAFHDIGVLPTDDLDDYEPGFLTDKGEFLTREQAKAKINSKVDGPLQSEHLPGMGMPGREHRYVKVNPNYAESTTVSRRKP